MTESTDSAESPPSDRNEPPGRFVAPLENRPASLAIVELAATAVGGDATELPPLYDFVDAGALDTLVETATGSSAWIEFSYWDFRVTIADGLVAIESRGV